MYWHLQFDAIKMAPQSLTCRIHKKVLKSGYRSRRHGTYHRMIFQCLFCDKPFSTNQSLFRHYLTHINEKPYFCKFCDKSFASLFNCSTHQKNHSGQKPFPCGLCQISSAQKANLKTHESLHRDILVLDFQCNQCEKDSEQKIIWKNIWTHI